MTTSLTHHGQRRGSRGLALGIAIGVGCGLLSWLFAARLVGFNQDFAIWWRAANALLHHRNPYAIHASAESALAGAPLFYYPLPLALAVVPFAWLPETTAGPLFIGLSCALLAYRLSDGPPWRFAMFLSASMFIAVVAANLAPLLTAALLMPSLAWLGVLKPNIGLAILAAQRSWRSAARTALVMAAIGALSLLVMPSWPREWIATAAASKYHFAPWRVPGGFLVLLVLIRWRRPEARMLAVLALVPSSPIVYEALPLFLIPRTRREIVVLGVLSIATFAVTVQHSLLKDPETFMAIARPAIVWLMYVPALVMVLRRPNIALVDPIDPAA